MAEDFEVSEHVYVNADKSKVVPEDSPEAAFLFAARGDRIPAAEAERLGLSKSGGAGSEPAQPGDTGAGAEAARATETDARRVTDKAIRGPKE